MEQTRDLHSADLALEPGAGPERLDYWKLPGFLGYQIRRAQSRVFAAFMAELADLDLTPGAFGLLALIRSNPGITQNQLARAFSIDKSTLTPVLNRLEARGLIERQPLESDRRFNVIQIPASARDRLDAILGRLESFEVGLTERLGAERAETLLGLLDELRAGLKEGGEL